MARRSSTIKVSILGDARDLQRAFGQATTASRSFQDRIKNDFSILGRMAKTGVMAIGGIAAAVAGLALKGGISRALNIEDARAKLRGLGHDAETVEAIMDNALAAVKGTAFGLDEAATIAASAVASGIEPGQELERTLKLVADAATIAGTPLNEMGAIFNKVQANGRMMTKEMNQLQDRGIPILQWLQEEFGVTAEEMRRMVTEGQVDAETFRKVIEDNIAGAALASGETTRGAFANVQAALSRLGATIVEKFLPIAKDLFGGLIEGVDDLATKVGPAMDAFAESPFFQKLQDHARRIPEYMASAVEGITRFWESTQFLRDAIGNVVAGAIDIVKWAVDLNRALGGIPAVLGAIAVALRALWTHPALAAVGGIAWLIGLIGKEARETQADAEALFGAIKRLGDEALTTYAQEAVVALAATGNVKQAMDELGLTLLDLEQAILGDQEALDKFAAAQYQAAVAGSEEASGAIGHLREEILRHNKVVEIATELMELHEEAERERAAATDASTDAVKGADRALQNHIGITEDATDATKDHTDATLDHTDATKGDTDAIQDQIDALADLREAKRRDVDATFNLLKAHQEAEEAQKAYTEAVKDHGATSDEAVEAAAELYSKQQDLIDAALEFRDEAGPNWEQGFRQQMESAGVSAETIQAVIDKVKDLEGTIRDVNGSTIDIKANVRVPKFKFSQKGDFYTPSQAGVVTLQHGGVVTGPTMGLIGEAGSSEAVIPLNRQGMEFLVKALRETIAPIAVPSSGGGQPVNITVNALDPRAAARAVVEALQEYERGNGPIPIHVRSA